MTLVNVSSSFIFNFRACMNQGGPSSHSRRVFFALNRISISISYFSLHCITCTPSIHYHATFGKTCSSETTVSDLIFPIIFGHFLSFLLSTFYSFYSLIFNAHLRNNFFPFLWSSFYCPSLPSNNRPILPSFSPKFSSIQSPPRQHCFMSFFTMCS